MSLYSPYHYLGFFERGGSGIRLQIIPSMPMQGATHLNNTGKTIPFSHIFRRLTWDPRM